MQFDQLRRREFIAVLGGAAAWPLAARAQQGERMRRIGVLLSLAPDDPLGQARNAAFLGRLGELGWSVGRNLAIEYRWPEGERTRAAVTEMIAFAPDVILVAGSAAVAALLQATRTLPTVFVLVADPVGAGFVNSLARPGGNATGFSQFEYSMSTKWLELLKEIAPQVTRAAVLRDSATPAGIGQFGAIQGMATSKGVEVFPINVGDVAEMERAVTAFARSANGGLLLTTGPIVVRHRDLIIALAARYKLPAVYLERFFVRAGGLVSYGPDLVEQYRQAAGYVDRILRGEKPADLPVQAPTKYELVLNLKTATALGLDMPATVLARADEVIE